MPVLSRRAKAVVATLAAVLIIALAFVATPAGRERVAAAFAGPTADPATMQSQGAAAERAIGGAHAKALEQLRRTRELRLPIGTAEADAIERRGVERLVEVRRSALGALADAFGLPAAQRDAYIRSAETRLDAGPGEPAGVLLAPRLTQIVATASRLAAQIADETTRALTQPLATPSPSPRATPSPSPRAP